MSVEVVNQSNQFLKGAPSAVLRLNRDPSRRLVLTSGHVAGAARAARRGDTMRFAPVSGARVSDGLLLDWQPNFQRLPGSSALDAALVQMGAEALANLMSSIDLLPTGTSGMFASTRLRLRASDGDISGTPQEQISIRMDAAGSAAAYTLVDALAWRPERPTKGGDSGAPVWDQFDQLVGIHAGSATLADGRLVALAVPIQPILDWADCSVILRGQDSETTGLPRNLRPTEPPPLPTTRPDGLDEADVLARTLYGEARNQGDEGLTAVGHVVLNRVAAERWWGRDVIGVCRKPFQFSCWNANDPNLRDLLAVTAANATFARCFQIARGLVDAQRQDKLARARRDTTDGATHYYAPKLVGTPKWALGRTPCARIRDHLFFKGIA